ncbi:MAG: hybrid sensor histidine kinase/response regulator [Myxococcales bacterium]|nr:hybrid sensor histidine kinase/response regulator [Myxococcales bacterium]
MPDRPRLLAVDDERQGVALLSRSLRRLGEVHPATSGEEAWALLEQQDFDLVVSDQRMPGMSGVELLARVAERDAHVGRILLTGYADVHATVDAINDGQVHAYLHKPCPPEVLVGTVKSVLERVELARENVRLVGQLRERNHALETALGELRASQQRAIEAERLSAIGSMIATIVHDFRSPVAIVGSAGRELAAAADRLPDDLAACASQIVEEGDRMARMGSELLEVTRASTGSVARVEDALDDVVEAALIGLTEEASRAGVELRTDLGSGARLAIDEDRLRRALLNLGFNAIEAMPEGGLLEVTSLCEAGDAIVSIRDTGCGIPDEIRERLFEPFVTAGKRNGSGLGLAIVKKIVEEHGGRVEVGKAEGGGTRFELHFPVGRAAAGAA